MHSDMNTLRISTLPNGLRVVSDPVSTVETVAVGVWVNVGTRYEDMAHNGVAHMVEHMLFKGTKTRSALDLAEAIENVGGSMNAYTSRELTSYYVHLLKDDLALAVEVLADMVQHSTLPPEEIERERGVILEEIGMCNDTPDDLIFDNYYETAYAGQALGAPILGKSPIIADMSRETLQHYIREFYTPGRMAVCASGNVQHEALVALAEKFFNALPNDTVNGKAAARYTGGEDRLEKDLEQSHVLLGFQGVPRHEDAYFAAQTLATLLGGGMSSRLFQEVREKRGLVYSIYSFLSTYSDGGMTTVYAGTRPKEVERVVEVVCRELKKLRTHGIDAKDLARVKNQMKGSLMLSLESSHSRMSKLAKDELTQGNHVSLEQMIAEIDRVTTDQVYRVAQTLLDQRCLSITALGPIPTKSLQSFAS